MQIVLTILAAVYVLFVPGFVLSFAFFTKKAIDWIERMALSVALSIATVPLVVFYSNLIGVSITQVTVFLEVLWIMAIGFFVIVVREFRKEQKKV